MVTAYRKKPVFEILNLSSTNVSGTLQTQYTEQNCLAEIEPLPDLDLEDYRFKLLGDTYSIKIELRREIFIALICSFLCGACFGEYWAFCVMK